MFTARTAAEAVARRDRPLPGYVMLVSTSLSSHLSRRVYPPRSKGPARVSPLGTTYLALRKDDGRRLASFLSSGAVSAVPPQGCQLRLSSAFSSTALGLAGAGITLFTRAHAIASARNVRLTAGGLLVCAASVLVLSFFFMSRVHSQRLKYVIAVLGLTTTALSSPFLMQMRPSWDALIQNPLFVLYLVVTFVIGMAIVAYLESGRPLEAADNAPVTTVLAHCLRLCAIACLALGISDPHVAAAVVALLIGSEMLTASGIAALFSTRSAPQFITPASPKMQSPTSGGISFPSPPQGLERTTSAGAFFGRRIGSPATGLRTGWGAPSSPDSGSGGRSATPASGRTTVGASPSPPVASPSNGEPSPMARDGFLFNSSTKKNVKIVSKTYHELLAKGYVVDEALGTISPAGTPASGASGSSLSSVHPRRLSGAMATPPPVPARAPGDDRPVSPSGRRRRG